MYTDYTHIQCDCSDTYLKTEEAKENRGQSSQDSFRVKGYSGVVDFLVINRIKMNFIYNQYSVITKIKNIINLFTIQQ